MEVLKDLGHRASYVGGWDENRWEIDCNDFDDESFNRVVEDQLDKILEKMEDSDDFIDVNKYSEIFDRITKNYNLNHKYKTKTGREFFIRSINPATNKIIVQVNKKEGGLEDRSYTEEEFNNFLVSPELFEGFIRIN
jgi:predicted nucleotide-binding protein (sugar kinase/HSP70/actin superfamily)